MKTNKEAIYPIRPWEIVEESFKIENNYRSETTFSLSNGYIGTRGTFEEAYDFDVDTGLEGNFINGFYESGHIRYGEANFGSPLLSQSLLNLPNLKETRLCVDGEELDILNCGISEYKRVLDMEKGILTRQLLWTTKSGKQMRINIERFVSFKVKNLMAISYSVIPLNFTGKISFISRLSADVENHTRKTNPIVDYGPFGRCLEPVKNKAEENILYYEGITKISRLTVACGSIHSVFGNAKNVDIKSSALELSSEALIELDAEENRETGLYKLMCYTSDLDMDSKFLEGFVYDMLKRHKDSYMELRAYQERYMREFWDTADVRIEGDDALCQGMRFNLFHIMQSAGRDGRTSMGAKGLSGEGYEGHYFWDTEMYMMPVFTYTAPEVSKRLLDYRYNTLDQARARAGILGHEKGALFPWRTINGEEASTYYPLGTAQYHINADIAYALSLYLQVSGDLDYFKEKGAEILIETARVWADVGSFAECKGGKYCICSVTGPDEYNVLVDNNFYTNLMARENLRNAVEAVKYLKENFPEVLSGLKDRLNFDESETELWDRIVNNMYFPYDEKRQIYPMDDGFMMRKPWDESKIPEEKRSWLYENYHPLFVMRHRMSKQADAILGMYLYSNLFTEEEIRRNYDFYQQVTLHHSSLSTCIFGIVACDIGYYDEAYKYFSQSARMDLDDYHNNFYAGIHAANMAGTWQAVVNGFAGLRCNGGVLRFKPYMPGEWKSYSFKIRFGDCVLKVLIDREQATFTLEKGSSISFYIGERLAEITEKGGSCIEKL